MPLTQFPAGPPDIKNPIWELLIPDENPPTIRITSNGRAYHHREWLRITSVLRESGTLGTENRHQIQRLIMAYVMYDRAACEVIRLGPIGEAPVTDVPKANIYITVMRHADADATTAEMELGIPPRRRGAVSKAKRADKTQRASDRYLRPLS